MTMLHPLQSLFFSGVTSYKPNLVYSTQSPSGVDTVAKTADQGRVNEHQGQKDVVKVRQNDLYAFKDRPKFKDLYRRHEQLMQDCPQLACAKIDNSIYQILLNSSLKEHHNVQSIQLDSYVQTYEHLLLAEYAYQEVSLRRFDMPKHPIKKIAKHEYSLELPDLIKEDINVIPTDVVVLSKEGANHIGVIKEVEEDKIKFEVQKVDRYPVVDGQYEIRFASSGSWLDQMKRALRDSERNLQLKNSLFPGGQINKKLYSNVEKIKISKTNQPFLTQRLQQKNPGQQTAIRNILKATCRPRPYVLFGPPGTGKTSTLIELIVQIYHRAPNSQLLVVGSSNSCADKLAADLKATKLIKSMVRLTSLANLQRCQFVPYYYVESVADASKCRLVVTTNMMSGRLKKLFDYVMVDEAGHASEPEVLMPLNRAKVDGCVVLAGDPKQLGPVVMCRDASALGLGQSLLVRLCETIMDYKRVNGRYNERYITQLLHCYRCDPRVLQLSNDLFYRGELICLNRTPPGLSQMMKLPTSSLFVNVIEGREFRERDNISRYNPHEVQVCVRMIMDLYMMGFEPHQIGVITPYKLQKEKILTALRSTITKNAFRLNERFKIPTRFAKKKANEGLDTFKLNKFLRRNLDWLCKVDTVDGFQGGEREVILFSLVRTPDSDGVIKNLHFVEDEKRFNVSLSRAKWLNIVVGHEKVMQESELWKKFLSYSSSLDRVTLRGSCATSVSCKIKLKSDPPPLVVKSNSSIKKSNLVPKKNKDVDWLSVKLAKMDLSNKASKKILNAQKSTAKQPHSKRHKTRTVVNSSLSKEGFSLGRVVNLMSLIDDYNKITIRQSTKYY